MFYLALLYFLFSIAVKLYFTHGGRFFCLFLHLFSIEETVFELDMLLKHGLTLFITLYYKITLATFKILVVYLT